MVETDNIIKIGLTQKIEEVKRENLRIISQRDRMLEAIDKKTEADETNHTTEIEKNNTRKGNLTNTRHQGHRLEDTIIMIEEIDRTLGTETNMKETMIDRIKIDETRVQTSTGKRPIEVY